MTTPTPEQPKSKLGPYKPTAIIHGGAGNITRTNTPPDLYAQYHASLLSYLTSTKQLLDSGSSAMDAACHAVCQFEDDPLFNCGRGSVFNLEGGIEMEASLAVASISDWDHDDDGGNDGGKRSLQYEGKVKRSAAVSLIRSTRHPILLAREVLGMADEDDGFGGTGQMHGHLSGSEVEDWGFGRGLEKKGPDWFWTKRRWDEHMRGLTRGAGLLDRGDVYSNGRDFDESPVGEADEIAGIHELPSQGTVGAVCMDSWGVIVAATSTGGLTNKRPGRIGDTPTVGAGFWAESWTERVEHTDTQSDMLERFQHAKTLSTQPSLSAKLAAAARSEFDFWLSGCSALSANLVGNEQNERVLLSAESQTVEKQPLMNERLAEVKPATHRKAVAMSGTGNGDSFLRTNACRTAAAICRFSSPSTSSSLEAAVQAVAGSDGELQKSAGKRWGETGEGQGGIIGIELTNDKKEGKAVFDFNCGGLWRAHFEKDSDGKEVPRVMVFREEY